MTKTKTGSPSAKETAPKSKSKSAASAPVKATKPKDTMTKGEFKQAKTELNAATRAAMPHVKAAQRGVATSKAPPLKGGVAKELKKVIGAIEAAQTAAKPKTMKGAGAEVSLKGTNGAITEVTVKIPKTGKAPVTKADRTAADIRATAVELATDIRKTAKGLPVTPATKKALQESAKSMDKVVESIDSDIARAKADPNYMSTKELFLQRPAGSATRPSSPTNPPHDRKSLEHEQELERQRNAKPTRPKAGLAPKPSVRAADIRTHDGVLAPKPETHGNDLKAQALKAMGADPASGTPKRTNAAAAPVPAPVRAAAGIRSELDEKARTAILGAQ